MHLLHRLTSLLEKTDHRTDTDHPLIGTKKPHCAGLGGLLAAKNNKYISVYCSLIRFVFAKFESYVEPFRLPCLADSIKSQIVNLFLLSFVRPVINPFINPNGDIVPSFPK